MKKKILILGKLPPPYMGPAIATEIILNSDLKNRFDLIHLDTRLNKSIKYIGKFSIRKIIRNMMIYFKFRILIKKENPELVLIPMSQSTVGFIKDSIYIVISRVYKKKVLLHLRGSNIQNWLKQSFPVTRIFIEWVIRKCQGAIVLGNNLKYLFEKYFPDDKIFVVPNGANYILPKVTNDEKYLNIIYLGNLMYSKGIQYIINAIDLLDEKTKKKIKFSIVGDWFERSIKTELLEIVGKKELPVDFHPPAGPEKKINYLIRSDIFVFTPIEPEGHPWVIVEAMAAGLPIISTDQGAITESVIDGVNGFIVEKKNPKQIAEKIKYLIDNPDIRKKMGKKSRELYLEKFTEEKMVENISKAFKHTIES